jgi:hypothetical protein
MPVFFQGQRIVTPQAVSFIDDSAMVGQNDGETAGVVAIIGRNDLANSGGQPQVPLTFSDPATAQRVLREGDLLDGVLRAFNPGPSGGAGTVIAYRVNNATRSTGVLMDTTAVTPLTAISLTSRDYGAYTARTSISVSNGISSGKNVSAVLDSFRVDGFNIGYGALKIQYTSAAGSAATASVTPTGITTGITGAPAENLNLLFADYPTLDALVNAINATGKYAASIVYSSGVTLNVDANGLPSSYRDAPVASTILDVQTIADIKTVPATFRADVQAVTDWINQTAGFLMTATRTPGTQNLANTTGSVRLTGGTNGGSVVTNDWQACLTSLQNVEAHLIVALTPDASVHSMVQTHVNLMSVVQQGYGRRERIGIVGGAWGETPTSTVNASTRAAAFQDSRMVVVAPGIMDFNPTTGALVQVPPYQLAAQIAGLIGGQPVASAITRRYVRAQSIENASQFPIAQLTQSERENWLLGGVCVLESVPGRGIRVVQGVTTWTGDFNYVRREISVRRAADWVARSVREDCDNLLVGQSGSPALLNRAIVVVSGVLRRLTTDGVIVGGPNSPSFRNIIASLQGDVLRIDFECSPAIPANYVLITAHMVPFSGTVTAA